MKKKKFGIIANPTAGRGKTGRILPALEEIIQNSKHDFNFHYTEYPRHATSLAEKLHKEYDAIVAVGGDGTANEVINGLAGTKTPFGLIPEGRGNDFARTINLTGDIQEAVDTLINFKTKTIDLGTIGNRTFLNGIGIGFDGYTNYRSQQKTIIPSAFIYQYMLLTSLLMYQSIPMELHIDGEFVSDKKEFLIAIGNGNYCGGGSNLNPNAQIDDGFLDICLIEDVSRLIIIRNLNKLKDGTIDTMKQVTLKKGKKFTIKSDKNLPTHFDGEVYDPEAKEINISIVPHAATVIYR